MAERKPTKPRKAKPKRTTAAIGVALKDPPSDDSEVKTFEGKPEDAYADALLWLARHAQRVTGIGAKDLTVNAICRERRAARDAEQTTTSPQPA